MDMNSVAQIRARDEPGFMQRAFGPLRKRLCRAPILHDDEEEELTAREGSEARTVSENSTNTSSAGRPERPTSQRDEGDGRGARDGVDSRVVRLPQGQEEQLLGLFSKFLEEQGMDLAREFGASTYSKPIPSAPSPEGMWKKVGTWKEAWTSKCEACLPYLHDVSTPGVIEKALPWAAMQVVWRKPSPSPPVVAVAVSSTLPEGQVVKEKLGDMVKPASAWFAGLKFAKGPGQPKKVWLKDEGKVQSEFRVNVIREVLRDIQGNAEIILRKIQEEDKGEEQPEGVEVGSVPEWMKVGFIRTADVQSVLEEKEGKSGSQGRRLRTKVVQEKDAARYAVGILYKQMSKTLISSRRRVGDAWFGRAGYLCCDWSKTPVVGSACSTHVSQEDLTLKFTNGGKNVHLVELDSIPKAAIGGGTKEEIAIIDAKNTASFAIVRSKLDGLVMDVEHEGLVKENGQWARSRCERRIRFLDLAIQMLLTFTFGSKKERLFRMDSDSFRKISALACMLFDIMLAYEGERARQGVAFVADLRTVRVGSINLDQLMPCPYRIKEVIKKGGCLTTD